MELKAILENRKETIKTPVDSIELTETNITTSNSIELPEEISSLITGTDYWKLAKSNRYKKLIRDGFKSQLMELAKIAQEKTNPAHWFATAASKKQWERTLDFLSKLHTVAQEALQVAKRLGVGLDKMKPIYKACWRGENVVQLSVTAQEIGRDPFKLFCWLARQKKGIQLQ